MIIKVNKEKITAKLLKNKISNKISAIIETPNAYFIKFNSEATIEEKEKIKKFFEERGKKVTIEDVKEKNEILSLIGET